MPSACLFACLLSDDISRVPGLSLFQLELDPCQALPELCQRHVAKPHKIHPVWCFLCKRSKTGLTLSQRIIKVPELSGASATKFKANLGLIYGSDWRPRKSQIYSLSFLLSFLCTLSLKREANLRGLEVQEHWTHCWYNAQLARAGTAWGAPWQLKQPEDFALLPNKAVCC